MNKNDYKIFDIFDEYTDEENHQRIILIIERIKDNTLFCVMLRDTGLIYIMQDDDNYATPASKEEEKVILNVAKKIYKDYKK